MSTPLLYPTTVNANQKTLDAALLTGVTASATFNNVTGIQNKRGVFVVDRVDGNNKLTPNKREYISFTGTSESTVVTLARGLAGSTDQDHAVGAIVEFLPDVVQQQAIIDGLSEVINPSTGALDTSKVQTPLSKATATENVAGTDDAKYLTALANVPAFNNSLYRQALINGNFDVWQRGTSLTASGGYIADRWSYYSTADGGTLPTQVMTRQALTPGDVPGSFYYFNFNFNGAGTSLGASTVAELFEKIEYGTRYLCGAGKKVTLSFWAKSDIANKKIGVRLEQSYGTGGSPTANETLTGTNWTLTSSWTKYSYTFTTNTLVGKTFGTADDDSLIVEFWNAWNTTHRASVGDTVNETFGGSGNVCIAQVQLCAGDVALPFMPKSFDEELRACMRYYEKSFDYPIAPANNTTSANGALCSVCESTYAYQNIGQVFFFTKKRTGVAPTYYNPYNGTAGQASVDGGGQCPVSTNNQSESTFQVYVNNSARTAGQTLRVHWTIDAEL